MTDLQPFKRSAHLPEWASPHAGSMAHRTCLIDDGAGGCGWSVASAVARTRAADPDALSELDRKELRRLRKEVIELRTDREILRKTAAYFARETQR